MSIHKKIKKGVEKMKSQKVELLHKTESNLWKIKKGYEIASSCERYKHREVPEWIINYARLKEVI